MSELSPYWGDPVVTDHPANDLSQVQVMTQHEGVYLLVRHDDGAAGIWVGPDEARHIARNLTKAADQWEED